MDLDLRTVLFLLFFVSGLLAVMLLVYWKTQKTYDGFSLWAGASAILSLSYLLITLRGAIPDFFSIVLANFLIMAGVILRFDGILRFMKGEKVLAMAYATLLPAFFVLLYFTYAADSVAIRGLITSVIVVPGLVLIAYVVLSSGAQENRSLGYVFAGFLCFYAVVYAVRTINWLFYAPSTVFSPDQINTVFLVLTMSDDILSAGLFLMLNMVRARSDLVASEDRYRMLSDSIPDYIVVHDGKSVLYANPSARELMGVTGEGIAKLPFEPFIAPESRPALSGLIGRIRADPSAAAPVEVTIVSPDGKKRICVARNVPVEFEKNPAILSVLSDITERKHAEDALRTVNRKLSLLSGMTRHDIRNKLTVLGGYLELSRQSADDREQTLLFIDKEMRIAETIAAQLSFTKDYEDLGVHAPWWQSVESLVRDAAADLPMQDVRLEVTSPGLQVYADPLLRKVFYNLIDNSLRYGGSGLTVIRVNGQAMESGQAEIVYEDDGAGIAAEDRPRLFTKGFGRNTGLGLFLSREILSITGITIAEDGGDGRGVRFRITVPEGAYRTAVL